ncbi:homoserine kinase [Aureibaculum sp. 2210JD6-5]|uniref:homoserine kinase n=1 Tax=Aureibaculum sp. 2210JD6-5 TaxID=3103957 RepID=UPI002AAE7170|nr:homoserine kinase [Aureibaculum sp. 2210JD6-5]MDY7395511.1 homoserine kinase [Aureibaculum sp. 2210JD6-5]
METIKIFAPATVANVSCGFDALGLAINAVGDEMIFTKTEAKGVTISKIEGADLTFDSHKNAAGVVAWTILKRVQPDFGVDIQLFKKVKPGSGLGSSASSSAGAAFGVNELLGKPFSNLELTEFARLGEQAACGSPIADNVAAAIYGGFILVKSYEPLEIVKLPVPKELWVTVIHPQIEIKTEDARNVLQPTVTVANAVKQSANLAGLISGLYTDNYQLIGRSLEDVIAEPYRKKLIPHFDKVKEDGLKAGALGAGISGSGPTLFALCQGEKIAEKVAETMKSIYKPTDIDFNIHVSKINLEGCKVISDI